MSIIKAQAPSRQFMVQQATLNAIAKHLPSVIRIDGISAAARTLLNVIGEPDCERHWFYREVRREFKAIASYYDASLFGGVKS